jgi:protein-S-isoprenylcysteine O-methyltransferase Ste14
MLGDVGLHRLFVAVYVGMAAMAFVALFFVTAPYGRHRSHEASRALTFGPDLNPRLGWVLMEAPALIVFVVLFFQGTPNPVRWIFFALWVGHYTYRSFLFPKRMKRGHNNMPLLIVALGIFHNLQSSLLNGWHTGSLGAYSQTWLADPRFLMGLLLFAAGFSIHVMADNHLRSLRREEPGGYALPTGGMFRWVSCPNYLGEMLQWLGWALCTWSLAGLAFFLFTVANLLPRALSHHKWYRENFEHYPKGRRAVIPGIL